MQEKEKPPYASPLPLSRSCIYNYIDTEPHRKGSSVRFTTAKVPLVRSIDRPTSPFLGTFFSSWGSSTTLSSSIGSPSSSAGWVAPRSSVRPWDRSTQQYVLGLFYSTFFISFFGSFLGLFFGTTVPLNLSKLFLGASSRTASVLLRRDVLHQRVHGVVRNEFLGIVLQYVLSVRSFPELFIELLLEAYTVRERLVVVVLLMPHFSFASPIPRGE